MLIFIANNVLNFKNKIKIILKTQNNHHLQVFGNSECEDSAETAKTVKSCPQNIIEWNEAAKNKGCEKMSHSCSSFEYHCVINAWGNETIEVCAPPVRIVGKNASLCHQMYSYQFISFNICI